MASYLQKLRRQSKQPEPHEKVESPPAPTVSTPSEEPGSEPVLDEEDQKFLERLAAIAQEPEGTPPALPTRPVEVIDNGEKKVGKDAQEAIMDGANKVPLPMSPAEETGGEAENGKGKAGELGRRKSVMSYFSLPAKFKKAEKPQKGKKQEKITDKDRTKAADDLHQAAEAAKSSSQDEIKKEEQDLTEILDQLNLSAVNNRVFSFSKESEELLNKFKLVLKDIVNGAPTAYNDLEKLFTDYEGQLKKMYGSLPPFLQNLVKSLPAKLTATLGPELMAAQAEKPGFDAKQMAAASLGEKVKSKARIPSLKELVSVQGAIATMLRSILNFLKLRFPALVTGTNAIMSLAVFLLLFVLWYCHKRGRETRLEKERLATEGADGGEASGSSSITEDNDSIFGDKAKAKSKQKETEHSATKEEDKPQPPLIISDNKEPPELPSVLHLPDPKTVPLPEPTGDTPAKETLK